MIQWKLTAGRFAQGPDVFNGGVLRLETSEELTPAREFGWILRSLGERGVVAAVDAVLVARPRASNHKHGLAQDLPHPGGARNTAARAERCGTVVGGHSDLPIRGQGRMPTGGGFVTRSDLSSLRFSGLERLEKPKAGFERHVRESVGVRRVDVDAQQYGLLVVTRPRKRGAQESNRSGLTAHGGRDARALAAGVDHSCDRR